MSLSGRVLELLGLHFGVHGGPNVPKMMAQGAIGALNGGGSWGHSGLRGEKVVLKQSKVVAPRTPPSAFLI